MRSGIPPRGVSTSGSCMYTASTRPSIAGATSTCAPRPASSSQNASCWRSRPARSGSRQPAASQSPTVAGRRTRTRRSGEVIDATPMSLTGRSIAGQLRFGIFDHIDDAGAPLAQLYEDRLRLAELYDRAGFYAYHCAEHHGTPLGLAPSPAVWLASLAQRTRRLRLHAMVFVLPLYDPLRLIEEICMLDQLSEGRLGVGIGRGVSPLETGFFGVDEDEGRARYEEALEVIRAGLQSETLSFEGRYYRYDRVPMTLQPLQPLQQPHPPLWLGI